MAFEAPIIIAKALDRIHRREYVLPAIQREFVGNPDKITRLFDSHMRGYARRVLRILWTRQRSALWKRPSKALDSAIDHAREQGLILEIPATGGAAASTLRPSPDGGVQPD
jgi:hypothetical protein